MTKRLRSQTLQSLSQSLGLSLLAVTDLSPLSDAVKPLLDWQREGMAGAMQYMNRPPQLLANPQSLLPGGKSAVCVALAYSGESALELLPGHGRVARYAWGRDYHEVIPQKLTALISLVEAEIHAKVEARVFSDATPILERALAARAKLGFVGKNSMLIRPGQGSFFFLAEILWDVEVSDGSLQVMNGSCGTCRRCIDHCPTKAFRGPYVLDARRCISYLSIEYRGSLSSDERQSLGEWVFGCDICQEICPFNHGTMKRSEQPAEQEFRRSKGAGPFLDLSKVLLLRDNSSYRRMFAGTALLRAKRQALLRNAACVAANTNSHSVLPALLEALGDTDPMVRQHSLWAADSLLAKGASLPPGRKWAMYLEQSLKDQDARVRDEARFLLERD